MTPVNSSQERLFVTNERFDLIQPRDFNEATDGIANNRIEQKIHLINTLGYFAAAKSREGFTQVGSFGVAEERYGAKASEVITGAARNAGYFKRLANEEFKQAVAEPALLEGNQFGRGRIRSTVDTMFAHFFSEYYKSPNSSKLSRVYRKQLETEVRRLQEEQTIYNREHGLHWSSTPAEISPNKKDASAKQTSTEAASDLTLDTQGRLQAIKEDVRAGFLPRSNSEKNLVITYLDYLDNLEYPLGVVDQLIEVWTGVQKYRIPEMDKPEPKYWGKLTARRAVESIVWELADYYEDAKVSQVELEALRHTIQDVAPRLRVDELDELDASHPGLMRLIRGMDVARYAETGNGPNILRDPLAGTIERIVPSNDRNPGRHKFMHDQYTRPDRALRRPGLEAYLQERTHGLTVKEIRLNLPEVLKTERNRFDFMRRRLEDMLQIEQKPFLRPALNVAKATLGLTD